jgi:saccharopine dehydrogenase-like NADP-dependent oxidoreductase
MKLLVIGSGMMGSAAAYDMARQAEVQAVTLADADVKRAREVAARINRLRGDRKVKAVSLDASSSLLPQPRPRQGGDRGALPLCGFGR